MKRVVIVGGGLAGITTAILLREQGYEVRLLEARRRLGGRVGSFEDRESSTSIDYCQHVGMACCTHLQWLIEKFQINPYWHRESTLHFFPGGKHLPIQGGYLPAPLHLSSLITQWPGLRIRDRFAIARGLLKLMRLTFHTKEQSSQLAIEWLRSASQSQQAIDCFWSTIIVSALGEQIDRVTIAAVRKVLIDGFAANPHAYHLLVPDRPLSELFGAIGFLELERRGIDVQMGECVSGTRWYNDRLIAVETSSGRRLEGDRFVFAVPWHRLSQTLAVEDRDGTMKTLTDQVSAINRIAESPITGIHTWWDRDWFAEVAPSVPHAIFVDRFCQWLFRRPIRDGEVPGETYYQIVISGSRRLPKADANWIIQEVVKDLAELFPASMKASLLRSKVVTDPNSVFSCTPETDALRIDSDRFACNNFWVAGDWTQTQWPSTMEGAIRSGAATANSICKADNMDPPSAIDDLPRGLVARFLIRE